MPPLQNVCNKIGESSKDLAGVDEDQTPPRFVRPPSLPVAIIRSKRRSVARRHVHRVVEQNATTTSRKQRRSTRLTPQNAADEPCKISDSSQLRNDAINTTDENNHPESVPNQLCNSHHSKSAHKCNAVDSTSKSFKVNESAKKQSKPGPKKSTSPTSRAKKRSPKRKVSRRLRSSMTATRKSLRSYSNTTAIEKKRTLTNRGKTRRTPSGLNESAISLPLDVNKEVPANIDKEVPASFFDQSLISKVNKTVQGIKLASQESTESLDPNLAPQYINMIKRKSSDSELASQLNNVIKRKSPDTELDSQLNIMIERKSPDSELDLQLNNMIEGKLPNSELDPQESYMIERKSPDSELDAQLSNMIERKSPDSELDPQLNNMIEGKSPDTELDPQLNNMIERKSPDSELDLQLSNMIERKSPDSELAPQDNYMIERKSPDSELDPQLSNMIERKSPDSELAPQDSNMIQRKSPDTELAPQDNYMIERKSPDSELDPQLNNMIERKSPNSELAPQDSYMIERKSPDSELDLQLSDMIERKSPDSKLAPQLNNMMERKSPDSELAPQFSNMLERKSPDSELAPQLSNMSGRRSLLLEAERRESPNGNKEELQRFEMQREEEIKSLQMEPIEETASPLSDYDVIESNLEYPVSEKPSTFVKKNWFDFSVTSYNHVSSETQSFLEQLPETDLSSFSAPTATSSIVNRFFTPISTNTTSNGALGFTEEYKDDSSVASEPDELSLRQKVLRSAKPGTIARPAYLCSPKNMPIRQPAKIRLKESHLFTPSETVSKHESKASILSSSDVQQGPAFSSTINLPPMFSSYAPTREAYTMQYSLPTSSINPPKTVHRDNEKPVVNWPNVRTTHLNSSVSRKRKLPDTPCSSSMFEESVKKMKFDDSELKVPTIRLSPQKRPPPLIRMTSSYLPPPLISSPRYIKLGQYLPAAPLATTWAGHEGIMPSHAFTPTRRFSYSSPDLLPSAISDRFDPPDRCRIPAHSSNRPPGNLPMRMMLPAVHRNSHQLVSSFLPPATSQHFASTLECTPQRFASTLDRTPQHFASTLDRSAGHVGGLQRRAVSHDLSFQQSRTLPPPPSLIARP